MNEEAGADFSGEVIRYMQAHDLILRQAYAAFPALEQGHADDFADLLAPLDRKDASTVQILRRPL